MDVLVHKNGNIAEMLQNSDISAEYSRLFHFSGTYNQVVSGEQGLKNGF
jgi:hypothetical protein